MSTIYNLLKKQKMLGSLPNSRKLFQKLDVSEARSVLESLPTDVRSEALGEAQSLLRQRGFDQFSREDLQDAISEIIYDIDANPADAAPATGGKRGNLKNTTDPEPEVMEGGNLEGTADADLGDTPEGGISDEDKALLTEAGFKPAEIKSMDSNPVFAAKAINRVREQAGLTPTVQPKKAKQPKAETVAEAPAPEAPAVEEVAEAPAETSPAVPQAENSAPQGMQDIYVETPEAAKFLNQRINLNDYSRNPAGRQTGNFNPVDQQSYDELSEMYRNFVGDQGVEEVTSPATTQGQAFADADPEGIEEIMANAAVEGSMGDQMAAGAYTPDEAPPTGNTFGDQMASGSVRPENSAAGPAGITPEEEQLAALESLMPEAEQAQVDPLEGLRFDSDDYPDQPPPPDAQEPPPPPGYPTQTGEKPIGSIAESTGPFAGQGYPTQSGEMPFRLREDIDPQVEAAVNYPTQELDPVPEVNDDPVRGIREMLTTPNPEQLEQDMAQKGFLRPGVMSRNTPEAFREVTGPITRTAEVGARAALPVGAAYLAGAGALKGIGNMRAGPDTTEEQAAAYQAALQKAEQSRQRLFNRYTPQPSEGQ